MLLFHPCPKAIFSGLLSIHSLPSLCLFLGLLQPRCRTLHLALLNFMGLVQAHLSISHWMASLTFSLSNTPHSQVLHTASNFSLKPSSPVWQAYYQRCCSLLLTGGSHQLPVHQSSQNVSHGLNSLTSCCGTNPVTMICQTWRPFQTSNHREILIVYLCVNTWEHIPHTALIEINNACNRQK